MTRRSPKELDLSGGLAPTLLLNHCWHRPMPEQGRVRLYRVVTRTAQATPFQRRARRVVPAFLKPNWLRPKQPTLKKYRRNLRKP